MNTKLKLARRPRKVRAAPTGIDQNVEYAMKLAIHTVKPRDSIAHARALLEEHRINQLPVVAHGKLIGIVTDRDLRDAGAAVGAAAAAASGRRGRVIVSDPEKLPLETVMSTSPITVKPKDSTAEAARIMRRERIGALPVVENGRLVGIITRSDVLDAYLALAARGT
jgi:acetoin utilization protein AcuB